MLKGIDVSKWQGTINWADVKKDVDFAIIKCGGNEGGYYLDPKFELNYTQATAVGLPIGCYFYTGSNFISAEQGVADAEKFLAYIKDKAFLCHVWVDIEEVPANSQKRATEAALAFVNYMEAHDFPCGIYASDVSGFVDRLDLKELSGVRKWVARYGSEPKKATDWLIWQTSSEGKVFGINGNVDMNEAKDTLFDTTPTKKESDAAPASSFLPTKGYWGRGDRDERIGRLCQFYYDVFPAYAHTLNRDKKNLLGNLFGDNCVAWTKEFQKRTKLNPDGYVGPLTYEELKKYGFKG